MKNLTHITLVCLSVLLITACSPGPSSQIQVAKQGLLSGAVSEDGKAAVVASVHHGGSFWDTGRKERLYNWNHKSEGFSSIRAAAISGDGKRAVTTEEDTLVVWNTVDGKYLQFWSAPSRVLAIKVNWNGSRALMGLNNGQAVYFNLDTGSAIHTFEHEAEVRGVDMDKDGNTGITGSDDFTAKIWNLKSGELLETKKLENQIKTVAISPSGTLAFVTAQRENTQVWNLKTGKTNFAISNRYTNYTAAAFSETEKTLVLGTFQGMIEKISAASGKEQGKWQSKPRQAYGGSSSKAIIDLTYSGKIITALTSDGQVQTFK